MPTVETDVEDLIGRALEKAGVIRYTALPSDHLRLTDLRAVILVGHIVESAAARLRSTMQDRTGRSPR